MAAPVVAQVKTGATTTASPSVASANLAVTTAGCTLLCHVAANANGLATTIVGPAGFTPVGAQVERAGGSPVAPRIVERLYKKEDAGGVTGAITATLIDASGAAAPRHATIIVAEVTGGPATGAVDVVATATGTGLAADSGTTPAATGSDDLALAFIANGNSVSTQSAPTNGFASIASAAQAATGTDTMRTGAYSKALASTAAAATSVTLSGATSRPWTGLIVLVKSSSAPAAANPIGLTTSGKVYRGDSLQEASANGFPDQATAVAYAQKRDFLTTNPGTWKLGRKANVSSFANKTAALFADVMVAANADLWLVQYEKSTQNSQWNGVSLPEQWYCHSTSSQAATADRVSVFSPSIYLMNPPDAGSTPSASATDQSWTDTGNRIKTTDKASAASYAGWPAFHAQACKRDNEDENARYGQPRNGLLKGIFLDSCGSFSLKTQNVPGTATRYAPATTLSGAHTFPVGTVTVASTAQFPASGSFQVGGKTITYTGKTATTFTGCTTGASGAVATGAAVTSTAMKNRWFGLVRDVVDAVKALNTGSLIVANGESNPGIESHAHVVMSENWLKAPTGGALSASNPTEAEWLAEIDSLIAIQNADAAAWILTKYWESTAMTAAQKDDWDLFLVCSYHMANVKRCILEINRHPSQDPYTQTHHASFYTDTLGAPLAGELKASASGYELSTVTPVRVAAGVTGVYGQSRNGGLVLLNLSGASRTITLDRTGYRTLAGAAVTGTTVTLADRRGMILLLGVPPDAPEFTTPPSIPDPLTAGAAYTTNPGVSSNTASRTYSQQRSLNGVDGWVEIGTGQSYTPQNGPLADVDAYLSTVVTARSSTGTETQARSNIVGPVLANPKTLAVTDPATDAAVTGPAGTTYTIRGSVQGYTAVTVNGQAATISAGVWSKQITLALGTNVVTVIASGGGASTATVTRTITLTASGDTFPPDLYLSAPTKQSVAVDQAVASYTVSGLAWDASGAPQVTVNGVAVTVDQTEYL